MTRVIFLELKYIYFFTNFLLLDCTASKNYTTVTLQVEPQTTHQNTIHTKRTMDLSIQTMQNRFWVRTVEDAENRQHQRLLTLGRLFIYGQNLDTSNNFPIACKVSHKMALSRGGYMMNPVLIYSLLYDSNQLSHLLDTNNVPLSPITTQNNSVYQYFRSHTFIPVVCTALRQLCLPKNELQLVSNGNKLAWGSTLLTLLTGLSAPNLQKVIRKMSEATGAWDAPLLVSLLEAGQSPICAVVLLYFGFYVPKQFEAALKKHHLLALSRKLSREKNTANHSQTYICPITMDTAQSPVVCTDGFVYEKVAILNWLKTKTTSPMTNLQLADTMLYDIHQRTLFSPIFWVT